MSVKHHPSCATQDASAPENTCDCTSRSTFAAPSGSADGCDHCDTFGGVKTYANVFERIIKLCEAYDNQDIEGQDPEDVMEAADLVVHQICEIACVEHARLSHHTGQLIDAPATCNKCHAQHVSPTTGKVWSKCYCGGELIPQNRPS